MSLRQAASFLTTRSRRKVVFLKNVLLKVSLISEVCILIFLFAVTGVTDTKFCYQLIKTITKFMQF